MPPETVTAAMCERTHEEVNGRFGRLEEWLGKQQDRIESMSQRAPKWATAWIAALSGALGSAVTVIIVLIRALLA